MSYLWRVKFAKPWVVFPDTLRLLKCPKSSKWITCERNLAGLPVRPLTVGLIYLRPWPRQGTHTVECSVILMPPSLRNSPAIYILVPNQGEMRYQWDESLEGPSYNWLVPSPTWSMPASCGRYSQKRTLLGRTSHPWVNLSWAASAAAQCTPPTYWSPLGSHLLDKHPCTPIKQETPPF